MEEILSAAAPENQPIRLNLSDVLSSGFAIGLKNILSLPAALLLWLVTIWIPYINIGTTIAIWAIPLELAKGKAINPLFIFGSEYRQYMGEVFLTGIFAGLGIIVATLFMIIPGVVLSLAWSQAIYLVLDKKVNPTEALTLSNKLTSGNKWTIFAAQFIPAILFNIASAIFMVIPVAGVLLNVILFILFSAVTLGINGAIYGRLAGSRQE